MDNDNLVVLGVCNKPHGIRGGFSFLLENVEDSVLNDGTKIWIFPKSNASSVNDEGEEVEISKISFGNKTIAYLKGVDNRNKVEEMIPFSIKISRDAFPELDEGEFYLSDLVGLDVVNHDTDEVIGKVKRVYDNTVQEILSVKLKGGKLVDILFIENFVPKIDLEEGKIWVNIPREF